MVGRAGRWGSGRLMIADRDTNVVFVADTLERRFPDVYRGLASILGEHGIPLRTIPGTRDVWCRDYMPIQVSGGPVRPVPLRPRLPGRASTGTCGRTGRSARRCRWRQGLRPVGDRAGRGECRRAGATGRS